MKQFITFALVGVTNTIVYYFVNLLVMLAIRPFSPEIDYICGNIAGFFVSVLWSFCLNNRLVFKKNESEKRNIGITLAKTYLSYAFTGVILSNIISYVLIDIFLVSKYIVPIINSVVGLPINFALNKFWAFRNLKK